MAFLDETDGLGGLKDKYDDIIPLSYALAGRDSRPCAHSQGIRRLGAAES